MRASIDVASRVSPELSAAMETIINDPDREAPPTLGEIRAALARAESDEEQLARLHPQERDAALVELEDLIEEFGEDALASDFVAVKASEALSRVIEAAMDDVRLTEEPTLGAVREAMSGGLIARLVGDGVIDADDDAALLAEMDELIARHGEDAVAEDLIRLE
jgi:hypothetical protein